jgi:fructose-1,6-bisphosphatase I
LPLLQNDILKSVLGKCKEVAVLASEEEDGAIEVNPEGRYVVVFDPLDGSRNIDAAIPTGMCLSLFCQPLEH